MEITTNTIKQSIVDEVVKARKGEYLFKEIKPYVPNANNSNEAVFFIKPEITGDAKVDLNSILDIILGCFKRFNISIDGVVVLGAEYLKKYDIMAGHYGVINMLAREGVKAFSEQARKNFVGMFGSNPELVDVLGAFQFLDKYDFFNSKSLDVLWENVGCKKLASGTYCNKLDVFGDTVYLINGFHPNQLEHYTAHGMSIVVMVLSSNVDWTKLRNQMIGSTDPESAERGSIRRTFLEIKDKLGLEKVNQAYNGVHLSAGPVESLAELVRFLSDYEKNRLLDPAATLTGKCMIDSSFSKEEVERLLSNPKLMYKGRKMSVFDLTEEMNTKDAIQIIKESSGPIS